MENEEENVNNIIKFGLMIILRQKTYSSNSNKIILVQKEYGVVSDVWGSSLKLAKGAYRFVKNKKKFIKDLEESIERDKKLYDTAISNHKSSPVVQSNEVEKKLLDRARNNKALVILRPQNSNDNSTISVKVLKKILPKEEFQLYKNILKDKRNIINHSLNSGVERLAHELGHVENYESPNLLRRVSNRIANSPKNREESKKLNYDESGVLLGLKRFIKGGAIVSEEKEASKKGLKLLKKMGLDENNLKRSKENLDYSDDSYLYGNKPRYKIPLLNALKGNKK